MCKSSEALAEVRVTVAASTLNEYICISLLHSGGSVAQVYWDLQVIFGEKYKENGVEDWLIEQSPEAAAVLVPLRDKTRYYGEVSKTPEAMRASREARRELHRIMKAYRLAWIDEMIAKYSERGD